MRKEDESFTSTLQDSIPEGNQSPRTLSSSHTIILHTIPFPRKPLPIFHPPLILVPRPPRRRTKSRSRLSFSFSLSILIFIPCSPATPALDTHAPTHTLELQYALAIALDALNPLHDPIRPRTSILDDLHARPVNADTTRHGFAFQRAFPFSRVGEVQAAGEEGVGGVELGDAVGGVGGGGEDREASGAGAAVGGDVGAGGEGDRVERGGDGAGAGGQRGAGAVDEGQGETAVVGADAALVVAVWDGGEDVGAGGGEERGGDGDGAGAGANV